MKEGKTRHVLRAEGYASILKSLQLCHDAQEIREPG